MECNNNLKPRCLLAISDPTVLAVLGKMFKYHGFRISLVHNGFQAFSMIKNTIQSVKQMFDLVLLDLNMSIMNGHDACRSIEDLFSDNILF